MRSTRAWAAGEIFVRGGFASFGCEAGDATGMVAGFGCAAGASRLEVAGDAAS